MFITIKWIIFYKKDEVGLYTFILIIFCMTLCSIASELFAYKARFIDTYEVSTDLKEGSPPRIHFDDFGNSFLAVFIFILNEEWHITMYDYMRTTGY